MCIQSIPLVLDRDWPLYRHQASLETFVVTGLKHEFTDFQNTLNMIYSLF